MTRARPAARPRAAQYLRMSTHLQPNSLAQQAAAIEAYAARKGYAIVGSYEDAAISGVEAKKRPAFRALLALVLAGKADFEVILVHDVSRWGRFQDPDEAAHYEFLCAQEGVRIEYCAEAFSGGIGSGDLLLKALKRAMAAEFSRELGAKVRHAQRRYAEQGYWLYGEPGYGLARLAEGQGGRPGRLLARGERNPDRDCRTRVVLGPAEEVEAVRLMFRLFVDEGLSAGQIATRLNQQAIASPAGTAWSAERVRAILANPKYLGDLVTHRRTTPLGGKRTSTASAQWVIARAAGPALVSRDVFAAAQKKLATPPPPSDADLLATLRSVAEVHGMVGEPQLKALGVPHHRSYRHRFGSLRAAFALVGGEPPQRFPKRGLSEDEMLAGLARLFMREGDLAPRLINADAGLPSAEHYRVRFGSLAHAYAAIGFVRISQAHARSALGQARLTARRLRIARWAEGRPSASEASL